MNRSTWERAKEIFDEARGLAVAERPRFLDEACGGNAELRAQVEDLLAAYESDFLEDTALGAAEALANPVLQTGQVIGRYQIRELVGTGGMGQVFLADDTELDRPVAFKVLHKDVAEDAERVRRFIQEARAASALNHPNILTIHEIGSFEGSRFIVSEYVKGETLREKMRSGLTVDQSLDITCQVATALDAAHSAGIVHRDIKPENVMIRRDGLVKVLDFGLAKLTELDDRPIDPDALLSLIQTSPGLVMGTAAYMSPEQARGQAVDARTDLWSLGVVLHEMLTGKSPFEGESATELITSILSSDTTPADLENLPPELTLICRKALTKEKENRYQSAHDLLEDLKGEKKRMEYAIQPTPFISTSNTDELKTQLIRPQRTLSAEYLVSTVKRHKYSTLSVVVVVAAATIGLSVYRYNAATPRGQNNLTPAAVINEATTEKDLKVTKFAGPGLIFEIAISADGKLVAYTTGARGADTASLRVRDIATQRDVEVVPAPLTNERAAISRLTFIPDNSRVIYHYQTPAMAQMLSVPVTGGTPAKVVDKSYNASISPDGNRIAYLTDSFDYATNPGNDLVIANTDGSNKRVLVHTTSSEGFKVVSTRVPAWSHDGKLIAYWVNVWEDGRELLKLSAVNTQDGSSEHLGGRKWDVITGAAWMPDGSLIIAGRDHSSERDSPAQLWRVTKTDAKRITNDPAGYNGLSASRDGSVLVTTQPITRRDLWAMNGTDARTARQVTFSGELAHPDRGGFSFLPDGGIVFSSVISNNTDLWRMNPDGNGRQQLTINQGKNWHPRTTSDGKYIVFQSDRVDGDARIFRMDSSGSNVKQLTGDGHSLLLNVSGDGRWVYYARNEDRNKQRSIYKVSIDGGETLQVAKDANMKGWGIDVFPRDGRIAECGEVRPGKMEMRIYSRDGTKIKQFPIESTSACAGVVRWTPDGNAVAIRDSRGGAMNLWMYPVDGKSKPRPLTNFTSPATVDARWSTDGKQLYVQRMLRAHDAIMITNAKE